MENKDIENTGLLSGIPHISVILGLLSTSCLVDYLRKNRILTATNVSFLSSEYRIANHLFKAENPALVKKTLQNKNPNDIYIFDAVFGKGF